MTPALSRVALLAIAVAVLAAAWFLSPAYVLLGTVLGAAFLLTLRVPLAGFCLLVFSVPWSTAIPGLPGGLPVTTTDLLVAAMGSAWLVSSVTQRRSPVSTWIWTPYLLLFLVAVLLSVTQAVDRHAALREVVKWVELLVVYLSGAHFLRRDQLRTLVPVLVLSGCSEALLGYVQFLAGVGPAAFIEHRLFLRAYGTFDQPNPFAGYLNLIYPLALAMAVGGVGRERARYVWAALSLAGAVFVSQSRGGLLATGAASVAILALTVPRLRVLTWLGALAAALTAWGASFGLVPVAPFTRILAAVGLANVSFGSVTDANFSAVERAAHWLAGVRMFADHPVLGVGIGNYAAAYPAYHPRGWYASLEHAHNVYINMAAEAGIVGLTAYLLVAGTALWYSYAAIRQVPDRACRAVVLGVLGALVATSLHNLFDVLYVHGMVALLGLLMALIPVSMGGDGRRTSMSVTGS